MSHFWFEKDTSPEPRERTSKSSTQLSFDPEPHPLSFSTSSPPLQGRPTNTNHDEIDRAIEKCVDSYVWSFLEDVREAILDRSATTVSDLSGLLWTSDILGESHQDLPLEEKASIIEQSFDGPPIEDLEESFSISSPRLIGDLARERAEAILLDLQVFLDDAGLELGDLESTDSITESSPQTLDSKGNVYTYALSPDITLTFVKKLHASS